MSKLLLLLLFVVTAIGCTKEEVITKNIEFNDIWTQMEVPANNPLSTIWGTSNSLYSVGGSTAVEASEHLGIIMKYHNDTWLVEKEDWNVRMILVDITGKSENEIWAIGKIWDGTSVTGILLTYDGKNWIEQSYPYSFHSINIINNEVYITASNAIYKLDTGVLVEIFKNSAHNYDIWGTSKDNLFVVGFSGESDFIFHFNGTDWVNMLQNSNIKSSFLQSIEGLSENEIYATGTGGKFLFYDGVDWQVLKNNFESIYDLSIVNSENIYFVTGSYGTEGKIYKYDKTGFSLEYTNQAGPLYGVWGQENLGIVAVGVEGSIVSKSLNK